MMEEMIKKLRRLSTGALMSLDEEKPTNSDENEPQTETHPLSATEEKQQLLQEQQKLQLQLKQLQQKAKELESLALPANSTEVTAASKPPSRPASANTNNNPQTRPIQPKGVFTCPITDCNTTLPFCRLLNHIRWNHKSKLVEIECTTDADPVAIANIQIPIPVDDYRFIVHVREFGLFVIVLKVVRVTLEESHVINDVTAFVKMVGTVSMAKSFNYELRLAIGKYVAQLSDMCHHAFTNEEDLPVQEQCLSLKVSKLSKTAGIQVKFSRNSGPRTRKPIKQDIRITNQAVYGKRPHDSIGDAAENVKKASGGSRKKKSGK